MSYSGNTVAQLKELLKQRNLSTDGLKADLITRLQEDDAKNAATEPKPTDPSSQAENKTENKTESTTGSTTAQENKDETTHQSAVQTGAEAGAETQAPAQAQTEAPAPAQDPTPAPKPQLSPEQLKQTAIDHLQKKIHRAEKFGQDDSIVEDLKRQINRIEKFGLDLTTQLAQELGFGKGPRAAIGKPNRKPFQKKHKNKKNIKRN